MPISGDCAWKEVGIPPEERIERFFNMIDHAVEHGIPLEALYRREHLKEFLGYLLPCGSCSKQPTRKRRHDNTHHH